MNLFFSPYYKATLLMTAIELVFENEGIGYTAKNYLKSFSKLYHPLHLFEPCRDKTCLGFPTRSNTNRAVRPQNTVRLDFWIKKKNHTTCIYTNPKSQRNSGLFHKFCTSLTCIHLNVSINIMLSYLRSIISNISFNHQCLELEETTNFLR